MTILKAKVSIVGERPILFNSFSADTIPLGKKEKSGVAGNDPSEWKRSVLTIPETRQLYLEPTYIFGCLRDGGKHTQVGRSTLQTKVASTLIVLDEVILLDRFLPPDDEITQDKMAPVYIDVRSVKNPATRGRNVRYRVAASNGWKTTFRLEWASTIVHRDQMASIINDAGHFVGLGDGRGIGFGRFIVEKFEIEEPEEGIKKGKKT